MVELGINVDRTSEAPRNEDANTMDNIISSSNGGRRATIGVLCVDADYRRNGVASDLVDRCERIVSATWGENAIYAEVEAGNGKTLSFFQTAGFVKLQDCDKVVTVRRRNKVEAIPHLLLSKTLDASKYPVMNTTATSQVLR